MSGIEKKGGGTMGFLRRLLKPRKHPRYYTTQKTFVVVSPYTSEGKKGKKIQILDISEGGCAFVYDGTKEELDEMGLLSLVAEDTPCLESVDFSTVSDQSLPDAQNAKVGLRRRSVEFKWLGILDREKLKEFIEQNSICHAS
jgi:c-di-GMP-binding flagellar brake protein YcgR